MLRLMDKKIFHNFMVKFLAYLVICNLYLNLTIKTYLINIFANPIAVASEHNYQGDIMNENIG